MKVVHTTILQKTIVFILSICITDASGDGRKRGRSSQREGGKRGGNRRNRNHWEERRNKNHHQESTPNGRRDHFEDRESTRQVFTEEIHITFDIGSTFSRPHGFCTLHG